VAKYIFLFDLDRTLVDTGGAGLRALDFAFLQHYQIREAMKQITPDGKTDPAIIREMIHFHLGRAPGEGEIQTLCQSYVDRLKIELRTTKYRVLPGIPQLLEDLSQWTDALVGLGTGNLEEGARAKLERSQLQRYFRFGGYSSDGEDRAEVLRTGVSRGEALAGMAVPLDHVYIIGDHQRDVVAGKAIVAKTVAVATGHMTREELTQSHPDFVFDDLSQTQDVLAALLPHVSQR
jgi:phosphoglycolate phosphatase